jgi:hypothetical protein
MFPSHACCMLNGTIAGAMLTAAVGLLTSLHEHGLFFMPPFRIV